MKYGVSGKAYLSAILDLADKSIVSFVIGHSNNNALVFETFDIAHENHPDAKPLFHSDRGYQYTSKSQFVVPFYCILHNFIYYYQLSSN